MWGAANLNASCSPRITCVQPRCTRRHINHNPAEFNKIYVIYAETVADSLRAVVLPNAKMVVIFFMEVEYKLRAYGCVITRPCGKGLFSRGCTKKRAIYPSINWDARIKFVNIFHMKIAIWIWAMKTGCRIGPCSGYWRSDSVPLLENKQEGCWSRAVQFPPENWCSTEFCFEFHKILSLGFAPRKFSIFWYFQAVSERVGYLSKPIYKKTIEIEGLKRKTTSASFEIPTL